MKKISHLFKDVLIYGIGNIFGKFISIFLVPILTRIFNPYQYGIMDVINTFIGFIAVILGLGLDGAFSYYFFQKEEAKWQKELFSTVFFTLLLINFGVILIFILFSPSISQILLKDISYYRILQIALLTIPLNILINILLVLMRARFSPWKYNLVVWIKIIFIPLFTLFFVVVLKMGLLGVFLAPLITAIIELILGLILNFQYLTITISKKLLPPLLRYGLPLIPATISSWILNLSDRLVLVHFTNLREVGLYSIGYKLASLLWLFGGAFQLAWGPFSFAVSKQEDAKEIYKKALRYFVIFAVWVSIFLAIFAKEILFIFTTQSYFEAYKVVGILCYSYVAYGAFYIVTIGLALNKKTFCISKAIGGAAILNLFLNFILIPFWGMVGAALATTSSYFLATFLALRYSQRYYPINYETKKIIATLFLGSFIIFIGTFLNLNFSWQTIFIKIFLLLSFIFLLYIFKIVNREEILSFKNLIYEKIYNFSHKS